MRPYRGRRTFAIEDPVLEPYWTGVRVLAHVAPRAGGAGAPDVSLIEELGVDVATERPDLAAVIGASVMAGDAVVDAIIVSPFDRGEGVGAAPIPEVTGLAAMAVRGSVRLDVRVRGAAAEAAADAAAGGADGIVAVDLLRLDGSALLDVPLLERKRLLESVVQPGERIRTSPHVRPPIEPWIATWKALGLQSGLLKAANSRYVPGQDTTEWRIVDLSARRSAG
jgi:hypothetical protein